MFVPLVYSWKFFNVKKFSRLCLLSKHSWNGFLLLLSLCVPFLSPLASPSVSPF